MWYFGTWPRYQTADEILRVKVVRDHKPKLYGWKGCHFVCFFHFNGWRHTSFGLYIFWPAPNIEIHVPGGFLRIGVPVSYRY